MQLVIPDILADARQLSMAITAVGLVLGLALWLFGWWAHRFWIAFLTTVLAGIYGLSEGQALGTHPLLAGLLLAICAGLLSLSLARLVAFAAGGFIGMWTVQYYFPQLNQPALSFLVAGLVGILLFRLWIMVLSSLAGALLASYSGLCLLDHAGTVDAVTWTANGAALLNWICAIIAIVGLAFQFYLDRRNRPSKDEVPDDEEEGTFLPAIPWVDKTYRKAG